MSLEENEKDIFKMIKRMRFTQKELAELLFLDKSYFSNLKKKKIPNNIQIIISMLYEVHLEKKDAKAFLERVLEKCDLEKKENPSRKE